MNVYEIITDKGMRYVLAENVAIAVEKFTKEYPKTSKNILYVKENINDVLV